MVDLVAQLAEQGRALPPPERVRLMDLLLASLIEPEGLIGDIDWNAEVARRVQAHERDEGRLWEAADVFAEAARIAP